MQPGVKYKTVLYCNPNLKSISPRDKKFIEEFKEACGDTNVEFLSEMPTIEKLTSLQTDQEWRGMVITDDFMDSTYKSSAIQHLFGRLGTHSFLDCALLVQFTFSKGEFFSSIFTSASAIVLFRNPSNRQQVQHINTKMFPKLSSKKGSHKFLQRGLKRAQQIMGVHAYIVINCCPQNPLTDRYQLSCNVLPNSKGEIRATYWKNPE